MGSAGKKRIHAVMAMSGMIFLHGIPLILRLMNLKAALCNPDCGGI